MIAHVLLPIPVDHPFDFAVGDDVAEQISVGKSVVVRFHGSERAGVVLSLTEDSNQPGELEPVLEVKPDPSFTSSSLAVCLDTAVHYLSPAGLFVNRLLPSKASSHRERYLRPVGKLDEITANIQTLSKRAPRQAEVLRALLARGDACAEGTLKRELKTSASVINRLIDLALIREVPVGPASPSPALAERPAVKAQGETHRHMLLFSRLRMDEYVRAIKEAHLNGESTLILEPEILIARAVLANLQRLLTIPISIYHSALPEGERGRVWNDVARGEARIVVGTRSAIFLPFSQLGLVIVDEEQDRSYKQDEMIPHYHARDMVARKTDIQAIFGSSAPSIETFYRAQQGEMALTRVPIQQTSTRIVDMKQEKGPLSEPLIDAITETLSAGRRILIGVNARGYFQAVLCKKCGQPLRCPNCGANLTYDVRSAQLVCRVCGTTQPRMACPNCGARSLRFVGVGSERIEQIMRERFPNATIARIDRTSLASKGALARAEGAIDGAAQIIVATPLATKGPVIPGLGLAAATGLDAILARPDFRAAERTYQYLTGLFGRLDAGGATMIQTSYPDHYAIAAATNGDYDLLYNREIAERKAMFYPPFSHLARIIVPHTRNSDRLLNILNKCKVQIIGPAPHPRQRARDVVLIKGKDREAVREACAQVSNDITGAVEIDIDPERL